MTEVQKMLPIEHWQADLDQRYPIYQQIISHFSRSLVRGEIHPGERIPSIRDLAMLLKVNANTIQRAYQEMEREQLIYSQRGTGYFVMNNEHIVEDIKLRMVRETTSRFLKEMRALGFADEQIIAELDRQLVEGAANNDVADNQGA